VVIGHGAEPQDGVAVYLRTCSRRRKTRRPTRYGWVQPLRPGAQLIPSHSESYRKAGAVVACQQEAPAFGGTGASPALPMGAWLIGLGDWARTWLMRNEQTGSLTQETARPPRREWKPGESGVGQSQRVSSFPFFYRPGPAPTEDGNTAAGTISVLTLMYRILRHPLDQALGARSHPSYRYWSRRSCNILL
jgi:hypothetical protein